MGFFSNANNTKNHKMSWNCIYISFTFTLSVTIKLVSKTQRLRLQQRQRKTPFSDYLIFFCSNHRFFFVNTVTEYVPGPRRPFFWQHPGGSWWTRVTSKPYFPEEAFQLQQDLKTRGSWLELIWPPVEAVRWSVHKWPDTLWRLTLLLIPGLRVCEWRRLTLESKHKERHFQRQQLVAMTRCNEQKCLQFSVLVPYPHTTLSREPPPCVWHVCENAHVFWEEPVKMMCTINVTVGQLHYWDIDLPLELPGVQWQRGEPEEEVGARVKLGSCLMSSQHHLNLYLKISYRQSDFASAVF